MVDGVLDSRVAEVKEVGTFVWFVVHSSRGLESLRFAVSNSLFECQCLYMFAYRPLSHSLEVDYLWPRS